MILRRLILLGAVIGGLAVSAITVLCAMVFALHSVFEGWLGPAGGWAALFAILAATFGAAAMVASAMAKGSQKKRATEMPVMDVADRFAELVRDRPVAAISTAVAAGVLAVRNPDRLASAIRKFAAGAEFD